MCQAKPFSQLLVLFNVCFGGDFVSKSLCGRQGITYSIMSASWDDDREGSLLGAEEFSQNVENIKTGLSRSRENAILRDKMDIGMYTQEDLDQTTKP
jgi:hypothetical protein